MPSLPLTLELAATPGARDRGLMNRLSFAPGTDGMLFVFHEPVTGPFWNPQTLLKLEVVYIGPDQRVLAVLPMRSIIESGGVVEQYMPPAPYLAAMELPRGRLAAAGVPLGAQIQVRARDQGRAQVDLVW